MRGEEGVLTGCDRHQEWLLPWWWSHYSLHNTTPVLFLDFGMSDEAIRWCRERGECEKMQDVPLRLAIESEIDLKMRQRWEECYGKGIWNRRAIWFKKPFALLLNPFTYALWVDLDCEVRTNLEPFFLCLRWGAEGALVRESSQLLALHRVMEFLRPDEMEYNAGVIAFRKGAALLDRWREEIVERNALHLSDQPALSRVIYRNPYGFIELPREFNWNTDADNPNAAIVHHQGDRRKKELFQRVKNDSFSRSDHRV